MSNAPAVAVTIFTPDGLAWMVSPIPLDGTTAAINIATAALGLVLMLICVCRMNLLNPKEHKLGIRLHYLLTFIGAMTMTGAPWFFPDSPGVGGVVFIASVLLATLLSGVDWRNGPPLIFHKDFPVPQQQQQEMFHEPIARTVGEYAHAVWRSVHSRLTLVAMLVRSRF